MTPHRLTNIYQGPDGYYYGTSPLLIMGGPFQYASLAVYKMRRDPQMGYTPPPKRKRIPLPDHQPEQTPWR